MSKITVIGLGPGDPKYLTREAWCILTTVDEIWLRTARHPVVAHLPDTVQLRTFDHLYESSDTFEAIYAEIAERLIVLAQDDDIYYAVPGHPFVGEASVAHIGDLAEHNDIAIQIVAGLSFIEPVLTTLSLDALDGLQIVDALDIVALNHPPINPDNHILVSQVYSRHIASELKLVLMNQYPDEYEVVFVDAAGTDASFVKQLPLYEIDRLEATSLTSLYIPALPLVHSFEGFQQTIAKLRSPDGCPWDREQTHRTLRANLLEEAYEVLAAIDADDVQSLQEELGDLLLQVVLHTQIAIESSEFYMTDVISGIDEKLKRRHPHVWGTTVVKGSEDVVVNWEAIKHRERQEQGGKQHSMLDGVPLALPSLAQATAYFKRVYRVGLRETTVAGLSTKVEVSDSVSADYRKVWLDGFVQFQACLQEQSSETVADLLGEMLLKIVRIAIEVDIDLESTLREANIRFAEQFKCLEVYVQQQNLTFELLTHEKIMGLLGQLNKQTPHC